MGYIRIFALLVLFCVSPVPGFALDAGDGKYEYTDPDSKKIIPVWYYKPASYKLDTPVVFVLHGDGRNAEGYRNAWKEYGESGGMMILVPEFSKKEFSASTFNLGNYFVATAKDESTGGEVVGEKNPKALWTFNTIEKLFTDFVGQRESSKQKTYYLYGHSAGGQFVHRMLLMMPEARVKLAIAANPGWYTMPDVSVQWPYGLNGTGIDQNAVKRFLGQPLVLLLGEKDNDPNHPQLRRSQKADVQGDTRLARGKYFFANGQKLSQQLGVPFGWSITFVPEGTHSNKVMTPSAAKIIIEDMQRSVSGK